MKFRNGREGIGDVLRRIYCRGLAFCVESVQGFMALGQTSIKGIAMRGLVAGLVLWSACTPGGVELRPGDRIIFLGDSITELGDQPDGFVALVRDSLAARLPHLRLEVIAAGVTGNKVPDLQERLHRDVLARNPDIVFVTIGVNDVWHSTQSLGGTPPGRYQYGLTDITRRLTNAGARVVLCTPTVVGERIGGANDLDGLLDDYAAITREVAKARDVALLDLRKIFVEHLRTHNPGNAEQGILTTDGVHLSPEGNRLVAEAVLDALQAGG